VDAEKTRFDFTHDKPMTAAEIREVERRVNEEILQNRSTRAQVMPVDDAKKSGAVMLFGEKYGDEVRVLDIGTSRELCGGTHVERTGDIGMFKIYSESGIASGVRRVEATTGHGALRWVEEGEEMLSAIARLLKSNRENLPGRIEQLIENLRKLEKEQEQLKGKLASSAGDDMLAEAQDVGGIKVLAKMLDGADPKTLRDTVDQLKNKLGSAALVLATVQDSKVSLVAGVTKDSTDRIKAGDLVNFVAQQVGGKGGGRPDMAQAGGNDPSGLPKALAAVPDWVRKQLGS
jgi:alanyl-tRNA synthetase